MNEHRDTPSFLARRDTFAFGFIFHLKSNCLLYNVKRHLKLDALCTFFHKLLHDGSSSSSTDHFTGQVIF